MSNNAIAVYNKIENPMVAAKDMGTQIAKSGMFGCKTIEQGYVVALTCIIDGITPLEFQRTYHIIDNKPTLKADAMLARFLDAGGKHKILSYTPEKVSVELTIDGETGVFTMDWALVQNEKWPWIIRPNKKGENLSWMDRRGELKDNWSSPIARQDMLWARNISRAVRRMKPQIVAGIYTPEEVQDFPHKERPQPIIVRQVNTPVETPEPVEDIEDIEDAVIVYDNTEEAKQAVKEMLTGEGAFCTEEQQKKIQQLFAQLKIPQEKITKILSGRGAYAIPQLPYGGAADIIARCEALAKK